jgi:hypothetical protein
MAQIDSRVDGIKGSISMSYSWQPAPSKVTFDDLNETLLAKEWNSFHLSRKLIFIHLEDFLKYKRELDLK